MTPKFRLRPIGILLLLTAFMAVSCDNTEESYDPITLSYDAYGPVFDNESKQISIPLFGESLPIVINGGDSRFSITNNSESIIGYTLDGKTLTILAISPGTGSIVIRDSSGNSYTLEVVVFNDQISKIEISSYAIVRGDDMDPSRIATLEKQIVADAPKGIWQFDTNVLETGKEFKSRLFLTDDTDSEYIEYDSVVKGDVPEGQMFPRAQIVIWITMKSDTEEFLLFICQPFKLDNGKLIRGYNLIRDVKDRYISEYPEITHAFEVQSYYPQQD